MNRRKETRVITRTVETRIEFTAADLRKRLRLPEDAVLTCNGTCLYPSDSLVATFTRTDAQRPQQASLPIGPDERDVRGTVHAPNRVRVLVENADGTKTEVTP